MIRMTRSAVSQARLNSVNSGILTFEFLASALIAGVYWNSWTVGIGVLLVLAVGITIACFKFTIIGFYSLVWCVLAVHVGWHEAQLPGAIVIGGFGSLLSVGVHWTGMIGLQESVS